MVGNKSESWRVRMGTGQELFSSQSHKSSLFPLCPSQFPLGTLPEPHFSLTPGNNTRKLWIQTDFFFNSCFFLGSRSSRSKEFKLALRRNADPGAKTLISSLSGTSTAGASRDHPRHGGKMGMLGWDLA